MSATTLAIHIKENIANMPDSINTKKGIEEYYKNAMKNAMNDKKNAIKNDKIKKKTNSIKKVIAKKSTKKVTTVGSFEELPVIVSVFTETINIQKKAHVISKIYVEKHKIQDTHNKMSQFTKDIEEIAELVKNKKINKKGYKLIYNYDDEPSFSTNILVTAHKINKRLISDRKEVFDNIR
jgi:hypothetical protein